MGSLVRLYNLPDEAERFVQDYRSHDAATERGSDMRRSSTATAWSQAKGRPWA